MIQGIDTKINIDMKVQVHKLNEHSMILQLGITAATCKITRLL